MNGEEKLYIMRKLMQERGFDAYIIPHGDQHNNEYIADADQRIKFISNFSGSNATGLVTKDIALMWTDSRYFIQIEKELYKCWTIGKDVSLEQYIKDNLPPGSTIGMDFDLFTNSRAAQIMNNLEQYSFLDDPNNMIDDIWGTLKPKYNTNKVMILPVKFSGKTTLEKYKMLSEKLQKELLSIYEEENIDFEKYSFRLVISKLDSIAWLLNLRGNDIDYNPLFFSYILFYSTPNDSYVHLFADKKKFDSQEISKYCKENKIYIFDYKDIYKELEKQEDNLLTVLDKGTCSFRMAHRLLGNNSGTTRIIDIDCIEYLKYIKNEVEISGFKNANIKDSVAVVKFLAWMEDELLNKKRTDLNEYEIGLKSKKFREEQELFMGESFHPICGCGPNAAIVHYHQEENKSSIMSIDKIILCDTGAQYMDGTTDITRTVHYGTPSSREKEMFTRVLLGNLSLERLQFKKGYSLFQLDPVARGYLNLVGLNYGHSTSHGVGHFLNVHEGPRRKPLEPGNILTNEPGYYETDQFGIRTENELLVVEKEKGKLCFENLTYIPYERNLIDMSLISNDFKLYIDNYHKKVYELISPFLKNDAKALDYLKRKTDPL